jgi:hypothetical protein
LDQAGDVLGYQSVADGVNKNVEVTLNSTPSSQWLYATLNKGGAVRSPWWKYPFVPDADYTSSVFLDPRAVSIDSRGGQAVDTESGTQPISTVSRIPYSRKCGTAEEWGYRNRCELLLRLMLGRQDMRSKPPAKTPDHKLF